MTRKTTRKVDELDRILIPKTFRELLNIEFGEKLEVFIDGEKVILQKANLTDLTDDEEYPEN